jgi:lipopolysaccharide heptosyltransferase II
MKILVRLPNWLGDVAMSTAFVNAIQQLYPGSQLDVIIKKELSDIAELITGINKIHAFSKNEYPGLKGAYKFGKQLRQEQYDLFFNLPSSLSSIAMARATRAKRRVGYGAEGGSFLLTDSFKRPAGIHRVDEYAALLELYSGKKIADRVVELDLQDKPARENMVVLNFNSEAVSRRMPVEKGRRLLQILSATLKDVKFALVGSPKEKEFIDELLTGSIDSDRIENYAGKTNLKGFCELMASAKAVLTTDSGPAHLANSLGTPTIVLFGAGDEHNTAPYNQQHLTVIRAGKLECEPCVRNTCKLYGIPKCMQLLDEMEIINALSFYLHHA